MKKVLVLLLTLSFVGVAAFAAAPAFAPALTVGGDASVVFGVNIDTENTGINNNIAGNITLTLVDGDSEKGAKEGEAVYGWIKIKSQKIQLAGGGDSVIRPNDGVEAKLFLGPVYVNILGDGPGTAKTIPSANLWDDGNDDAVYNLILTPTTLGATLEVKRNDGDVVPVETVINQDKKYVDGTWAEISKKVDQNGLYVGLTDTKVVDVKIGALSVENYKDSAVDHANYYTFWAAAGLTAVENLTLEAKTSFTTRTSDTVDALGLGVKGGYKIVIAEGYAITPMVAFDAKFLKDMAWRAGASLTFSMPGANLNDFDKFGTKVDVRPGLGVTVALDNAKATKAAAKDHLDVVATFVDGDLIPVVDLFAIGEFFNLLDSLQLGAGVWASADFGQVVPFAGAKATLVDAADLLRVWAGFDLKVITNTTFTLGYTSGDLTGNSGKFDKKGMVEFTTKIAF